MSIAAAGLSRFGEASGGSLQPGSRGASLIPPGKPFSGMPRRRHEARGTRQAAALVPQGTTLNLQSPGPIHIVHYDVST